MTTASLTEQPNYAKVVCRSWPGGWQIVRDFKFKYTPTRQKFEKAHAPWPKNAQFQEHLSNVDWRKAELFDSSQVKIFQFKNNLFWFQNFVILFNIRFLFLLSMLNFSFWTRFSNVSKFDKKYVIINRLENSICIKLRLLTFNHEMPMKSW